MEDERQPKWLTKILFCVTNPFRPQVSIHFSVSYPYNPNLLYLKEDPRPSKIRQEIFNP